MRGGAFLDDPNTLRATVRTNRSLDNDANGLGFRVAKVF
jgi:hypothetical protein